MRSLIGLPFLTLGRNQMTTHPTQSPLQQALFKAAKVGHIRLMKEFAEAGADPFALDEYNRCAIQYAQYALENETSRRAVLLKELSDIANNFKKKRHRDL